MFARASLVALSLLGGCGASMPEGSWPSLARRPGEMRQTAQPEAAAPAEATAPATPQPGPPAAEAGPRLATMERDLAALDKRWRTQVVTTRGAVTAARNSGADAAARADAEVELTRLEQIGAQLGDMRERLDGIAGDAAAAGGDAEVLRRTGALITRLEALRQEHRTAFQEARAALAR